MSDEPSVRGDQIETEAQAIAGGMSEVDIWLKKIKQDKEDEKDWREDAKWAIDIYEASAKSATAFNILHANTETVIPALYNSTPVPDVRRRYGDGDPIAKQVADVSERTISYSVDEYDFDGAMISAVRASVVAGRGVLRLRYHVAFDPKGMKQPGTEKITCEAVPWNRWGHGPGRQWADVPHVWFEHDLTREELIVLNKEAAKRLGLGDENSIRTDEDDSKGKPEKGVFKTAKVYEVWDKSKGEVLFIAEQDKIAPLKRIPDPLKVTGFFPVVRPIQAVKRIDQPLVPICSFKVYKPLLEELDRLTKRINKLINQLKVRGLVSAKLQNDFERLKDAEDGQYEPASDEAAAFANGRGGLEQAIAHWPMDPTVQALQQLYLSRNEIIGIIDRMSGVADVMRGAVDPREKLGQSQIKAQWGSLRVQAFQSEIVRAAREVFRMTVEIAAEKFDPPTISMMTGLPMAGDQQAQAMWPQVLQVFKSDARHYKIDIETDSTIRADMTRDQEQMNLFMGATAQFVSGMQQAATAAPAFIPTMIEVYTAFARKFKLGKQAEDALDKLGQQAPGMVQQMLAQKQQNPEAQKAQFEQQASAQKHQQDMQIKAQDHQANLTKMAAEMQNKREEHQMNMEKMTLEMQATAQQHEIAMQTKAIDHQHREHEFAHRQRMDHQDAEAKRSGAEQDREIKGRSAEQDMAIKGAGAEQERANKQASADQDLATKKEASHISLSESAAKKGVKRPHGPQAPDPNVEAMKAVADGMKALAAQQMQIAEAVSRPRKVTVQRDKSGRAVGAVSEISHANGRG